MKAKDVLLLFLCLGQVELFAQRPPSSEQTRFSAEDDAVQHPIALPDSIGAALAQDPDVKGFLNGIQPTAEIVPKSWFLVSEVWLSGSRERHLVVVGREPILGANVTTFWIFRAKDTRFDLLLKVVAHTVEIKNTRSRRYRDIVAMSATGVTFTRRTFKFDGTKYGLSATITAPIQ